MLHHSSLLNKKWTVVKLEFYASIVLVKFWSFGLPFRKVLSLSGVLITAHRCADFKITGHMTVFAYVFHSTRAWFGLCWGFLIVFFFIFYESSNLFNFVLQHVHLCANCFWAFTAPCQCLLGCAPNYTNLIRYIILPYCSVIKVSKIMTTTWAMHHKNSPETEVHKPFCKPAWFDVRKYLGWYNGMGLVWRSRLLWKPFSVPLQF